MQARSYTTDQQWADMTQAERVAWFSFHGPRYERAVGVLVKALDAFAAETKACGAHDARIFSCEDFTNKALDAALRPLSEEVREYLGV